MNCNSKGRERNNSDIDSTELGDRNWVRTFRTMATVAPAGWLLDGLFYYQFLVSGGSLSDKLAFALVATAQAGMGSYDVPFRASDRFRHVRFVRTLIDFLNKQKNQIHLQTSMWLPTAMLDNIVRRRPPATQDMVAQNLRDLTPGVFRLILSHPPQDKLWIDAFMTRDESTLPRLRIFFSRDPR